MNRKVNRGKVILLCLMVFSVSVEAGKKERRTRRESACSRVCRVLGFPLILASTVFSTSQAVVHWSYVFGQNQMSPPELNLVCNSGHNFGEVYKASWACDAAETARLVENGYNVTAEVECFAENLMANTPTGANMRKAIGSALSGWKIWQKANPQRSDDCLKTKSMLEKDMAKENN